DGDTTNFTALMAMTRLNEPAQFEKLQRMLDLPAYIDYLLLNFYAGNHDWGESKNWYAIGARRDPHRFRYCCWDGEFILQDLTDDVVGSGSQPFHLLAELRANSDFMVCVADHIQRHFFGSGALTSASAAARWMQRARELDL